MAHILILGGGASGLAAALAAKQTNPDARVTVLERNPRIGKKLLATGNGRCNLDHEGVQCSDYASSDAGALHTLLDVVEQADPLGWFHALGLYTRTDETGRVYPNSNQAADVLALLEYHLTRYGVELRTGCTVQTLSQSRSGYLVLFSNADGADESLYADAVICAMGGSAGPQFGTDGFGPRFAAQCGGRLEPLYPALVPVQCEHPDKSLAGIRAKAAVQLHTADASGTVFSAEGEVQFTEYGLSGICIMDLTRALTPNQTSAFITLDLFPEARDADGRAVPAPEAAAPSALLAEHAARLRCDTAGSFWTGLLHPKLGQTVWKSAGLPKTSPRRFADREWNQLAHAAQSLQFGTVRPMGWKQAQVTGGGLSLTELEPDFQFKGCPGLYFVGETLDCTGRCGGYNLHWAFGSGLAAGRSAARQRHPVRTPSAKKGHPAPRKKKK